MIALRAKVIALMTTLVVSHPVTRPQVRGIVVSLLANSLSLPQMMSIILHFFRLAFPRFVFLATFVLFEFLFPATLEPI